LTIWALLNKVTNRDWFSPFWTFELGSIRGCTAGDILCGMGGFSHRSVLRTNRLRKGLPRGGAMSSHCSQLPKSAAVLCALPG
jgi:hypothetical protein